MRLHPSVTHEEALRWLGDQVAGEWGPQRAVELRPAAEALAKAMAAISATTEWEGLEEVSP